MEITPTLSLLMRRELERIEAEEILLPAEPWSGEEKAEERRIARVQAAIGDFWSFDKTYISPDLYPEGYAQHGELHRRIVNAFDTPGIHFFLAFRKGGKSVTGKKAFVWSFLTGAFTIGGTLSVNLTASRRILRHIKQIILDNPRIVHDFRVSVVRDHEDELTIRVHLPGRRPHTFTVSAFSEDRSVRGYSSAFGRPQIMYCDDLENRRSPRGEKHIAERRHVVTEAKSSCTDDAVFIGFANVFAKGTLAHRLKEDKRLGLLDKGWHVTVWPAWHPQFGSGWPEKYPATSEGEMREMLGMSNLEEWSGDGQQEPRDPDGDIFPRANLSFWNGIPEDARGGIWTDPNLSKKNRGDTTAICALLFSPTTWKYYVLRVRCRSFSDSNDLLDAVLDMWMDPRVFVIGFDGHVNQESTWENNIRMWCRINKRPFPHVEFRRYNVDLLSKNASGAWKAGRIEFPPDVTGNPEGSTFIDQTVTFAGKKADNPDDAPDALICIYELLNELGMAYPEFPDAAGRDDGLYVVSDFSPF